MQVSRYWVYMPPPGICCEAVAVDDILGNGALSEPLLSLSLGGLSRASVWR